MKKIQMVTIGDTFNVLSICSDDAVVDIFDLGEFWYNDGGRNLHRENAPAGVSVNGQNDWWRDGDEVFI